jgi:RNase adaptor protein for sRNA GlmZ degradation
MKRENALPMKRSAVYTEQLGLRIESELKDQIQILAQAGVDTMELAREGLREKVSDALKTLKLT